MSNDQINNEFQCVIKTFENGGCSVGDTITFIKQNFDFVQMKKQELSEKIYFIYNHQELYGALVVNGNDYSWSIYHDKDGFGSLQKIEEKSAIKTCDYIVEMMIHFADTDKVKQVCPNVSNMNIENKVKTLKQIGLNTKGYHFK